MSNPSYSEVYCISELKGLDNGNKFIFLYIKVLIFFIWLKDQHYIKKRSKVFYPTKINCDLWSDGVLHSRESSYRSLDSFISKFKYLVWFLAILLSFYSLLFKVHTCFANVRLSLWSVKLCFYRCCHPG